MKSIPCSTDKGVHALSNIAHVDLQHFREGSEFEPSCLLRGLNNFLKKTQTSLVISQVERVPDTFNARHEALSRHYMYRLGITSKSDFLPTAEWDRCHFIREPFCIDTANEVSLQLQGTHDYASFCHGLSQKPEGYPTVRTINTIQITEGRPLLDPKLDPFYSGIRFYDIHVTSRSFMYRQVRRMVAVLIAAGQKRMNAAEVQQLFDKPGTWNSKASVAPAHGLYLVNVEHKPIIKPVPTLNETQP